MRVMAYVQSPSFRPGPKKVVATLGALGLIGALLAVGYARDRGGAASSEMITEAGSPVMSERLNALSGAPAGSGMAADAAKVAVGPSTAGGASGAGAAPPPAPAAGAPQQALPLLSPSSVDRMIVKTGALTVQLGEGASGSAEVLGSAMARVNALIASIPGAYVAASSMSYRPELPLASGVAGATGIARETAPPRAVPMPVPPTMATLTLKVPVDSFDQTMQRLREIASPISENVSTQEVTEEYFDLEAQVRNLEATEQQYLRFLERAQRIEEILPIQQRLTEVRGQIERVRGRMTLLQRRSDISTITVSLVVPSGKGGTGAAGEPRAVRTLKEAWAHLSVALSGALDLLIYLAVYALPLGPLVAAAIWWRRRQSRPAAAAGGAV